MGIEVWIVLLLAGCAVSGWIGYAVAARGRPTRDEVKALEESLAEAKAQAETVQANVNEHFEQSAILFGRLAKDYREFLDHFSDSARSLGLSEGRARELIEQGFQPVLTHEAVADIVPDPGPVDTDSESGPTVQEADAARSEPADTSPEPPVLDNVVEEEVAEEEAIEDDVGEKVAGKKVGGKDQAAADETVNAGSAEPETEKDGAAAGAAPEPPFQKKPETAAVADVVVEMPGEVEAADEARAAAEKEDTRKTGP